MIVCSEGGENDAMCRKINNNKISKDITKHAYIDLPRDWSEECVDPSIKTGLAEINSVNEYNKYVQYNDDLLHLKVIYLQQ